MYFKSFALAAATFYSISNAQDDASFSDELSLPTTSMASDSMPSDSMSSDSGATVTVTETTTVNGVNGVANVGGITQAASQLISLAAGYASYGQQYASSQYNNLPPMESLTSALGDQIMSLESQLASLASSAQNAQITSLPDTLQNANGAISFASADASPNKALQFAGFAIAMSLGCLALF